MNIKWIIYNFYLKKTFFSNIFVAISLFSLKGIHLLGIMKEVLIDLNLFLMCFKTLLF